MLKTNPARFLLLSICLVLVVGCDLVPGPSAPIAAPSPSQSAGTSISSTVTLDLPPCMAGDLRGVAGWQGATGGLAGGIFLENKGNSGCGVQGWPGVHIIGADGAMLPITDVHSQASGSSCCSTVALKPGDRMFASFDWRNWCGQAKGPFSLAVALPGEGGQVNVPVLDPAGTPLSDTPRCDSTNEASTIVVGPFVAPPGP